MHPHLVRKEVTEDLVPPAITEDTALLEMGPPSLLQQEGKGTTTMDQAFTSVWHSGRLVGKSPAHAMATVICSDSWVHGALALGASVQKFHPNSDLVVLLSEGVSADYHDLLGTVFDNVLVKKPITPHPSITRNGADCVTLKLWLWRLPYKKVLYMDADMIMFTNIDPLFESYGELTAKRDLGTPVSATGRGRGNHGWNS